jgi:peptide/nickel transport system substrate-binding protein
MFQNNNQIARRTTATGFDPGITEDLNFYRTIRKS